VVFCVQERFEMLRTLCPKAFLVFEDRTRRGEVAIDLSIKVIQMRNNYECPVAGEFPQDFLREENHRETLAGALRVPEHAELALLFLDLLCCLYRPIAAACAVITFL
jgi:hypothetical protein